MSDEILTNAETVEPTGATIETTKTNTVEETKPVEVDPNELKTQVEHWKKFSRQHEDTAKQLAAEKDAWTKAREEYEAKLSSTSSALEEKVAELSRIRTDSIKTKVATEYKLPESALKFLTASDEEGIKTQAEELAGLTAGTKPKPLQMRTQGQAGTNSLNGGDPLEALKQWQIKNLKK